jgi:hypothetical protein
MAFRSITFWLAILFFNPADRVWGQATDSTEPSPAAVQGSAVAGKALFIGAQRFQKGGRACAACHTVAGLAFPNGGSLGPDLTAIYSQLGDVGLDVTMQTLYFPTMVPIFNRRLPTAQEQADLKAFFVGLQSSPPPRNNTLALAGLAGSGCVLLLAITWGLGRSRPEPVRQSLLKQCVPVQKGPHELD